MSIHELRPGGGGIDRGRPGGNDGGMEARVAKLEALAESTDRRLSQIEGDLRSMLRWGMAAFILTWGGIIALGIGLAAMMAKGFGWL